MTCPKCGAKINDGSNFCTVCGNPVGETSPQAGAPTGNPQVTYISPTDHTAEFSPKDISDNKVMAMLPYLMGIFGTIISLLAARESAYTYFHVRQSLKITVVNTLLGIATLLLFWTIIVPIITSICFLILTVIRVICFFQVCGGKAKEPMIICSLKFLK